MALTLSIVGLAGLYIVNKLTRTELERQEYLAIMHGALAFIALSIVAAWLTLGIPRGQYPTFDLLPVAGIGLIATFCGLRAYKVLRDLEARQSA